MAWYAVLHLSGACGSVVSVVRSLNSLEGVLEWCWRNRIFTDKWRFFILLKQQGRIQLQRRYDWEKLAVINALYNLVGGG